MFSASLLDASSAYGLVFVSPYLSVNSLSSSNNLLSVIEYLAVFNTYFSGWNLGSVGGVTVLLNSLSAGSVTFATNALAVPSWDTVTVTSALIVSYVTVVSVPATSSTV